MASFSLRRHTTFIFAGFLVIIFFFSSIDRSHVDRSVRSYFKGGKGNLLNNDHGWTGLPALQTFWADLALDLEASRPPNPPPRHGPRPSNEKSFDTLYSIEMTPQEIDQMRDAHKTYTTYTSTLSLEDLYSPGTQGIVTTAGGKYVQIMLVSLRMLRLTGSQLPVEVFLDNDSEYDEELCERILPALNAKCRVMSHILKSKSDTKIEKYQFKVFSIIFSSFEDVIFLDADNLPARDPEYLFSSKEYLNTGMVLWPDFWGSTISPLLYDIQGSVIPGKTATKTIESGQMLVSKSKHGRSLILAAYYNFYGPKYYYPLLSRGAPGEGDKETFSVAADYFGIPYHLIDIGVRAIGFFNKDDKGEFRGGCMMQSFPSANKNEEPKAAFMHANYPKMNPSQLMDVGNTNWKDGRPHRMWHDLELHSSSFEWGEDPEKSVFKEIAYVACQHGRFVTNPDRACKRLQKHLKDLFGYPGNGYFGRRGIEFSK